MTPAANKILVGTSSWTDPGFIQDWYPPKLPASERLRWYAEHFDLVEVNSTFYAIPPQRTVARWCEETPSGFTFDVKLPKALSRHAMAAKFLPPDLRARISVNASGSVHPAAAKLREALHADHMVGAALPNRKSDALAAPGE